MTSSRSTTTFTTDQSAAKPHIAFIGGGNMASAMIGGLVKQGLPLEKLTVVEPFATTRASLRDQFGLAPLSTADQSLGKAELVVWAVKPQNLREAVGQAGLFCKQALHLSVAAGIRSDSLAQWLDSQRIVRAMPNTPALVGLGQTGLFARPGVSVGDKTWVQWLVASTGQFLWVSDEAQMDAITAVSGSGPAYVFFFMEAMEKAAIGMGLSAEQAKQLAIGTFVGASALAQSAQDPVSVLRDRVTSKGGTTHAAIACLQSAQVDVLFQDAIKAAQARAQVLGDAFGKND
ncbi:MAG: pyrroline-5-carboxylate reductase [Burkholderiales bacterium]|nr:pyrroline-5-carboxylate reductase [Burkholderiales bacterium]